MDKTHPIGIFDSGVGGLSICHAIRHTLPKEDIIYFADTGFSPYGNQPKHIIDTRSEYVVDYLINKGCKAIVIACNTATVHSVSQLRTKFSVPIIGVEPAIKPAAHKSQSGVIGVLATTQTLRSSSFEKLKNRFSDKVQIEVKSCSKFVDLVEALAHESEEAYQVAEKYITPLLSKGCDQIILGCTHFSFLNKAIERVVQGKAAILETATPVAAELERRLRKLNIQNDSKSTGNEQFVTSGSSSQMALKIGALWHENSVVHETQSI